ncbi:MAG: plastocyanin/azurin family copper-binding protein [Owenweeksia sp.]
MKRFIAFFAFALIFTSCANEGTGSGESGSDGVKKGEEVEQTPVKERESVEEVSFEVKTVGETMTEMKYEPNRLEVAPGTRVTIILENAASSEAMIHNWVLIEAGSQGEVTQQALDAGVDKDFIPDTPKIIAATGLANPGETQEMEFVAPDRKGTYQFICTYPGHTSMKGIFLVK